MHYEEAVEGSSQAYKQLYLIKQNPSNFFSLQEKLKKIQDDISNIALSCSQLKIDSLLLRNRVIRTLSYDEYARTR